MISPSLFGRLDKPASAVLFAGLGGACEGIRRATGASPIVAVNHCKHALWLHGLNHPETIHLEQDVFDVETFRASRGRKIELLWLSPDCTHHSRAKGGQPRDSGLRSTADVVFDWIKPGCVRPAVVMLENVPEFEGWGPVDEFGRPIPERKGEMFRDWVARVRACGYRVDWRCLVAADYGAPTTRRRLYLVARRDGQPIVWPEPTHGPGRALPWRTAGECIDWSIPALSIFATRDEAKAWAKLHGCGIPQRPLAEATLRRVARGLVRFVIESPKPYLVSNGCRYITKAYGTGTGSSLDAPCPTVTTGAGRGNSHLGLVSAWLAKHNADSIGTSLDAAMDTVTVREHFTLCEAALSHEEHAGARRVAAFLSSYYGQGVGQSLNDPMRTVTTLDRFGLVTVVVEGMPRVIYDVTLRMLRPRELARAMGFPDSYRLEGSIGDQVARIGGAVCPPVAEALVRANVGGRQ